MTEKILIVDDEVNLQEAVAYHLTRQGYDVVTAGDGKTGLDIARTAKPDLIILDIMLPGMDGFEVCRILRQEMTTPILMLTARDDEIDRVVGLEVGADDYLVKPFSMRELMARIKAMLRRVRLLREEMIIHQPLDLTDDKMKFGDLEIDLLRHEVMIQGRPIALKPKEYELLVYLARHQGQALRRESILQEVWGWDYVGDSRTVDVHIRWLREKIEADPTVPSRIVTVRGAGYRFEG
ncbi:MAG TPA: response regulator transcription factor [Anaerolineaceae bacterium]|mgnify:FL=1|nr:response regulator transcription factor [Chloroflexota bacterium]HOD44821.1 response regulator transcription factor [Anaerolineaceae bacterium]HQO96379.1 response regulator transcription factor [Anaerolineaceae bacterium]